MRIRIVSFMQLLLSTLSIVLESRVHRVSEWLLKVEHCLSKCRHYIFIHHWRVLLLIDGVLLMLLIASIYVLLIKVLCLVNWLVDISVNVMTSDASQIYNFSLVLLLLLFIDLIYINSE